MGIITGLLRGILEWLNKGLFQGGLEVLKAIIGDTMYYLSFDEITGLLPNVIQNDNITISLFDIGTAIAWGVYIALFMVEGIKLITTPVESRTKSPLNTFVKYLLVGVCLAFFKPIMVVLTAPFKILGLQIIGLSNGISTTGWQDTAFYSSWSEWPGFFGYVGGALGDLVGAVVNIGEGILDSIGAAFATGFNDLASGNFLVGSSFTDIAQIVISFTLFTSILGAGLIILERYLSLAVTLVLGPIFVSLGASDSTSGSTKEWFKTVIIQFISILISWFGMFMFLRYYSEHVLVAFSATQSALGLGGATLFDYAFCVALLQIVKNSEKFFNVLGFRTLVNKDSVGEVKNAIGSFMNAMRIPTLAMGAYHGGKKIIDNIASKRNQTLVRKGLKEGYGSGSKNIDLIDKTTNGSYYYDNVTKGVDGKPLSRTAIKKQVMKSATDDNINGIKGVDLAYAYGLDSKPDYKVFGEATSDFAVVKTPDGQTQLVRGTTHTAHTQTGDQRNFIPHAADDMFGSKASPSFTEEMGDGRVYSANDVEKLNVGAGYTVHNHGSEKVIDNLGNTTYTKQQITITNDATGLEVNAEDFFKGGGTYYTIDNGNGGLDLYRIKEGAQSRELYTAIQAEAGIDGNYMYRVGDKVDKGQKVQKVYVENWNIDDYVKPNDVSTGEE